MLLQRKNTGFCDGEYSFIAGHVEDDESFSAAAVREAEEEAGITVKEENLIPVHFMHRNSDDSVRVDMFFLAEKWEGDPVNREPDKCSDLSWFPMDSPPGVNNLLYQKGCGLYRGEEVLQRGGLVGPPC